MQEYEELKLDNQLCFPLYAVSKEIVRRYKPFLDALDLTYTQYITMMVLWEEEQLNVKDIGKRLFLDSGTLTPLLKQLENKGYVTRSRDKNDERNLIVSITPEGEALKEKAKYVPESMGKCVALSPEEAATLYKTLHKLLDSFEDNK